MTQGRRTYFISGHSRSGSELLCNILAQNPDFHATATSSLLEVILSVRNAWDQMESHQATPDPEAKIRVMRAALNIYHGTEAKVVFDKCRGWVAYMELLAELLPEPPKVIVPVRDVRQILASWEKLYRRDQPHLRTTTEATNYMKAQTTQGRAEILMAGDGPVGVAHNRIKDAIQRGWAENMFFVDFDGLTSNPETVLQSIYEFLGEPYFEHDFEAVEQVTQSNDIVYGFRDLHTIRPKVQPQLADWAEVLGEWAHSLHKENFWRSPV